MSSPSSQKEFVKLIKDDLIEFDHTSNNPQINLQSSFSNDDMKRFKKLVKYDLVEFYQLSSNLHINIQKQFDHLYCNCNHL